MVGNASKEGIMSKLDHPSHRDPVRTIALLFLVAWIALTLLLSTFGLTLSLSFAVALVPVTLIFLILRQIRRIRSGGGSDATVVGKRRVD